MQIIQLDKFLGLHKGRIYVFRSKFSKFHIEGIVDIIIRNDFSELL